MIGEACLQRVYLACGSTDLRKSIDGLAILVKEGFELDPFSPCLFVFCNRKRDKLKILHWEHNGFWLHYRRLEKGKFQWPEKNSEAVVAGGSFVGCSTACAKSTAAHEVTARTVL